MRFDFLSFLIGFIAASLLAYVLYQQREAVARIAQRVRERVKRLLEQLSANMESRYQVALRAHCDQFMLTRAETDFDALYLDRRFEPPPIRPTLAPPDPGSLLPISLSAALRSTMRLAVLGEAGSGRTTVLVKLARAYLAKQAHAELGVDRERLPILLHLAEIDWAAVKDDDPISPLLQAATAHVPRLVAANVASMLRGRVRNHNVIVLLDGFDELTAGLRPHCTQWLTSLIEKLPDDPIVITTGPQGYGPLYNIGFAPLQFAAWTTSDINQFAQRWITLISGGKQDLRLLSTGLRQFFTVAPRPIDLALAAVGWRAHAAVPATRVNAFEQWIDRAISRDGSKELLAPDRIKAALARAAWTMLQDNRLELGFDEIEQAVTQAQPTATPEEPAKPTNDATAIARDIVDRTGLLLPFGVDGWTFAHRHIAAYLAARHAIQTNTALDVYWDQPEWADVLEFHAAMSDPAAFVNRALTVPDDIGRTHLWTAARWTSYASPDAAWRSRVMSELARALIQPDQFACLRDRALNGLLTTQDKGLAYLLKRGLAHPDPAVRVLGLRGMSMLNREPDLPVFMAALNDPAPEVKAAAIRAIGVLAHNGSLPATEQLIKQMLEQDEHGRRLAAELLAECGEEGYQILREGAEEEDIQVRRAAAYGLAATGQDWARELVRKLMRDDKQWFVRSAAEDALRAMDTRARQPIDDPTIDLSPIVIDQQGWLVEWAARQGIGIGVGRQANQALMRALDEGDTPVRLAALQTLLYVGDLSHHDKLRMLLYDPDRAVRDAAFTTLETIGQRMGQPIPR